MKTAFDIQPKEVQPMKMSWIQWNRTSDDSRHVFLVETSRLEEVREVSAALGGGYIRTVTEA